MASEPQGPKLKPAKPLTEAGENRLQKLVEEIGKNIKGADEIVPAESSMYRRRSCRQSQ